jgi:hypothetical protein
MFVSYAFSYTIPLILLWRNLQIMLNTSTIKLMAWRNARFTYGAVVLLIAGIVTTTVHAQSLQSSNYRFDESVIGTGGLLQSNSSNYSATSATGDIGNGPSGSTNFQANSGSRTTPDPTLTFKVLTSAANFGTFSPSTTTTATATFSVINYTTYGYVVQLIGGDLKNGTSVIDAMTTTGPSQPGLEQFGVNLVANTNPTSFGANPNNGQFGYGSVATNYGTTNEYRYIPGETIALATKNSGETIYTMSYIVNVAQLTPGGIYTSDQTLVVTGTY